MMKSETVQMQLAVKPIPNYHQLKQLTHPLFPIPLLLKPNPQVHVKLYLTIPENLPP